MKTQQQNKNTLPKAVSKELKENYPKYFKTSQLAYYSSLESISKLSIFSKSSCDVECNVIFSFDAGKFDCDQK